MDSGSLQGEREFHNEVLMAEKMVQSDRVIKLLGFASSRRRRRMCLVYELMPNGNLQDCLLLRKCEELMVWSNRFRIAVQVAQGLAFLHHHCDPPIIHGDIKPSNILLDANFCAKIGDFGLARFKLVDNNDHVVVDLKPGNVGCGNVGVVIEDSGSLMETESVTTTVGFEEGSVGVDQSPARMPLGVETSPEMVTAVASPIDFFDKGGDGLDLEGQLDRVGVENSEKEMVKMGDGNGNGNRKAKHQKPEDRGESDAGQVKDYVMEWIGTEISGENDNDCVKEEASLSSVMARKAEKRRGKKKFEWCASMDEGKISKKEKRRPAREWWKEEYSEELARKAKKKKKKKRQGPVTDYEENWWPGDNEMYVDLKKKSRSKRSSRSTVDWWLDGLSGDLWKDRHTTSYDSMSGEIPRSGGISSTPSMRGTVCYIAPEYCTGSDLSEKCDVYSFGVLLLVLIAGRRPLQVTGSPMSEFHRANLVSWARQLARAGKLLDLVDKKIRSLNREQAQLCIVVALICLQKSPARRPSMKEVVGMLTGELDPPQLPMEYNPSPSSQFPFKSRKKLR